MDQLAGNFFKFDYEIIEPGEIKFGSDDHVNLSKVINYSFEGNLSIVNNSGRMNIVQVPLIEIFYGIREALKILPIYYENVPLRLMHRESLTLFGIIGNQLKIEHKEISPLRQFVGAEVLLGDYVAFCRGFGVATKRLISEVEERRPEIFQNRFVAEYLKEIYMAKMMRKNFEQHSIA
jgi:hypothetical protein